MIINYSYKKYSPSLTKKLFGYRDTTKGGKYTYCRPGLLSSYSWKRVSKEVLQINNNHAKEIIKIMKKSGLIVKKIPNV